MIGGFFFVCLNLGISIAGTLAAARFGPFSETLMANLLAVQRKFNDQRVY